ncbi:allergen [Colletotrichum navitas]|uniref:Allergen n=1 Tax=Colletotrichum navitas TaxID=681940 RepID=A0AAD8PJL2_9PEZI|nr:allergen [Colletotrichum navitas]KAK1564035.1 allergen [Colletotrichum navitas]
MDKAKQAVEGFVSKDGHHKTTVHQDANNAVTEEHVRPHRHEEVTTAVDKEVHQDHHHTKIQPIQDKQVLPEKHHHNVAPIAHKSFDHGDSKETKHTLDREHAKFKDTSVTHDTTHTSSAAPVVTGERVHHHVHEHIQPVIQKEVVQPHVVHTTVPIHETHHAKPVHHEATTLPTKTLEEFNREKGGLDGHGHHKVGEFDGCPDKMDKGFAKSEHAGVAGTHDHNHGHKGSDSLAAAQAANARHTNDPAYTTGTAASGASSLNESDPRFGSTTTSTDQHDATGKKVSLVDKLNPFKDADGDGKKGIMS